MINRFIFGLLLLLASHAGHPPLIQAENTVNQSDSYGEQLGTVRLPLPCDVKAQRIAERGLALLHHMTYEGARASFTAATRIDPDCIMGYWGQAMSFIHPLWSDPPSEDNFMKAQSLLQEARKRAKGTERELLFIGAVEAYFSPGRGSSEKANLVAFKDGWQKVFEKYPLDPEAACFFALSYLATADPADKSYAKQKFSSRVAKKVLWQVSDHPGAHHYVIHANDYPSLASKALEVARNYGNIAPAVPHALHMPTHIFTRLGLWEESVTLNKRSADAALKHPAGDKISLHYLHALDYLAYAYLQRGEDEKASEVLGVVDNLKGPYQTHVASAYTMAAIPARIALEQHQWKNAAMLKPRIPENYPWEKFPAMEAITYFARALGAARSGDIQTASQSLDTLTALQKKTAQISAYWAKQVETQRLSAQAWFDYEQGRETEALDVMQRASELEASTEKHPVTPGKVLPAQELYADMLLKSGRYKEAHKTYVAALANSPNRFNSLYGAGRSAELANEKDKAVYYYKILVEMTAEGSDRERLTHARNFFVQKKSEK